MPWFKKDPKDHNADKPSPGIGFRLTRKDGLTRVDVTEFVIKNPVHYFDHIIEAAPINMMPGDSLVVTYNLSYGAYVNKRLTDSGVINMRGEFNCTKKEDMRFFRFTHVGGESKVRVYETLPELPTITD